MLSAAIERVQAHHIPAVRCEERRTRAAGCRAGRPVVAAKPRLVQQLVRGSAQGEARRPVWIRSSMRMRGHSAVNAPLPDRVRLRPRAHQRAEHRGEPRASFAPAGNSSAGSRAADDDGICGRRVSRIRHRAHGRFVVDLGTSAAANRALSAFRRGRPSVRSIGRRIPRDMPEGAMHGRALEQSLLGVRTRAQSLRGTCSPPFTPRSVRSATRAR